MSGPVLERFEIGIAGDTICAVLEEVTRSALA